MPYRLDDDWFVSQLDSVSREHTRAMGKRDKGGKTAGGSTPPSGPATPSSGSAATKTDPKKKKPSRSSGRSSREGSPIFDKLDRQDREDQRVVMKASRELSRGKELCHIREGIPSASLQMGEERLKRAVGLLGIGLSKPMANLFSVKGTKLSAYTGSPKRGPTSGATGGTSGRALTSKLSTDKSTSGGAGAPSSEATRRSPTRPTAEKDSSPTPAGGGLKDDAVADESETGAAGKTPRLEVRDTIGGGEDEDVGDEGRCAETENITGQVTFSGADAFGDDGLDSRDRRYIPPALVYSRPQPFRKNYVDVTKAKTANDWKQCWNDRSGSWVKSMPTDWRTSQERHISS